MKGTGLDLLPSLYIKSVTVPLVMLSFIVFSSLKATVAVPLKVMV